MELHEKLKTLRKLNNFTQQNISEQFNISRQAVQKWESGETYPDITKLPELAEMFAITVDDLLNPNLTKQSLLKKIINISDENRTKNPDFIEIVKKTTTIDWILFSIILFGTAVFLILLHLLGVLIVVLSLFTSLAFAGFGLYSLANTIIEIQVGYVTIISNIGLSLVGLILSFLSYKFFILLIHTYIKFVKDVTFRFKDYGLLKSTLFFNK